MHYLKDKLTKLFLALHFTQRALDHESLCLNKLLNFKVSQALLILFNWYF